MTIDNAIKVIKKEVRYTYRHATQDIPNAFRLSIEALKRVQIDRCLDAPNKATPLPGETEE